jgi:hypothetical protein
MDTSIFFLTGKSKTLIAQTLLLLALLFGAHRAFSQKTDSTGITSITTSTPQQTIGRFSAGASATNNGISLIPSFSLGKPAAVFDLTVGNKRLSFEPQFRFALTGRPWSFIFWWRYKLLKINNFTFNIGAHPSVVFRERTYIVNGDPEKAIIEQQYVAAEFVPNLALSKTVSIGAYYLVSHGFDRGTAKVTNFIALRSTFSRINLSKKLYLSFTPQVFYLRMDNRGGFYANSTLVLAKRNFPFSISSVMSKTIVSDIIGAKPFIWNISLNYLINKNYVGI